MTHHCIKYFRAPSFPHDYLVEVGERVKLIGYIHGCPVIELDPELHKSSYAHLPRCSAMLQPEAFAEHFAKLEA